MSPPKGTPCDVYRCRRFAKLDAEWQGTDGVWYQREMCVRCYEDASLIGTLRLKAEASAHTEKGGSDGA